MKDLLIELANINSYSYNIEGLEKVKELLKSWYKDLENKVPNLNLKYEEIELKAQEKIDKSGNITEQKAWESFADNERNRSKITISFINGTYGHCFPT